MIFGDKQGSGIGGRGVYPPGRKNFENTPPEDLENIYPPSAARSAAAIFLAKFWKLTLI